MKHIFTILVLLLAVNFSTVAQLSKEEKKEWKKRAKEMAKDPEMLKNLVESEEALQSQVASLNNEADAMKSQLNAKDERIGTIEAELEEAKSQLASTQTELATMKEDMPQLSSGEGAIPGVVFKVQIGAFRNKDLSKYFDNHPNFAGEISDGTQKITLGQFSDYWEADTFKKYLREMGVSDAWIVPYKDGQRVPIKDVLEGVVSQ
jgi:Mg2+ and Co2+ transporter CorA